MEINTKDLTTKNTDSFQEKTEKELISEIVFNSLLRLAKEEKKNG